MFAGMNQVGGCQKGRRSNCYTSARWPALKVQHEYSNGVNQALTVLIGKRPCLTCRFDNLGDLSEHILQELPLLLEDVFINNGFYLRGFWMLRSCSLRFTYVTLLVVPLGSHSRCCIFLAQGRKSSPQHWRWRVPW